MYAPMEIVARVEPLSVLINSGCSLGVFSSSLLTPETEPPHHCRSRRRNQGSKTQKQGYQSSKHAHRCQSREDASSGDEASIDRRLESRSESAFKVSAECCRKKAQRTNPFSQTVCVNPRKNKRRTCSNSQRAEASGC